VVSEYSTYSKITVVCVTHTFTTNKLLVSDPLNLNSMCKENTTERKKKQKKEKNRIGTVSAITSQRICLKR
jgi:hypothetical protein